MKDTLLLMFSSGIDYIFLLYFRYAIIKKRDDKNFTKFIIAINMVMQKTYENKNGVSIPCGKCHSSLDIKRALA